MKGRVHMVYKAVYIFYWKIEAVIGHDVPLSQPNIVTEHVNSNVERIQRMSRLHRNTNSQHGSTGATFTVHLF